MIVLKHPASDSWYLHGRKDSQLNSCYNQLLSFPSQILINLLKWAGHNAYPRKAIVISFGCGLGSFFLPAEEI
jgi:hypothetical protein